MAKRKPKTAAPKPTPAKEEPGLMLVRLQLPPSLHQKFRVLAAKEGRSISNMARRVIEDWIAERDSG